jgi:hypothetical protein
MAVDPRLPFRRRRALRASFSMQHHPDRTPAHSQFPRDRLDAGSLPMKRAYLFVPGSPPLVSKLDLGGAFGVQSAHSGFFGGNYRLVDPVHRLPQAGMLGVEKSLDCICHIRTQMPAIGDLNSRRSALPRAISICAGAIAANKFHSGILLEPRRQRRRFPVRKEINCGAPLKVHQDRAVTLPFVFCPIIDSDDLKLRAVGKEMIGIEQVRREVGPEKTDSHSEYTFVWQPGTPVMEYFAEQLLDIYRIGLALCEGKHSKAARLLGLDRKTLER